MLFNSLHYLLFLPVTALLYYLIPFRQRWMFIFLASCYFYMAFVPSYILILFVIIIIDYTAALAIERNYGRRKKAFLVMSILSNILLLAFFKYFNFLNENLVFMASSFGKETQGINLNIILPIGLSFHTFQSMGYVIDVYYKRQQAEKHLGYFSNYVLFFPQMVAGPIERYNGLGNELRHEHNLQYENISNGLRLILLGLFVKMTIADNLAPFVNQVYADPVAYGPADAMLAVTFFSFQIYADFYGYSTIALGSARLLGIRIMDNFRTPYLSRSISEFWTRWHISLSSWFRDYLYIPLGGNRVKLPRWALNIMIVFTVSGLWHGASWTFVVWGALHGALLLTERFFSKITGHKIREGWTLMDILLSIKTFVFTTFIWIFFRAESFSNAREVIGALFSGRENRFTMEDIQLPLLVSALLILSDIVFYRCRFDTLLARFPAGYRWAVYALIIFFLFALSGVEKFTFIYFQF